MPSTILHVTQLCAGWLRAEHGLTPLRSVQQPRSWSGLPQRCRFSTARRSGLRATALCCTALLALRAATAPGAAGRLGQRGAGRTCAAAQALSAAAVPSFQVLRVPGDGSCLFRALAQGRSVLERGASLSPNPLPAASKHVALARMHTELADCCLSWLRLREGAVRPLNREATCARDHQLPS